MKKKFLIFISLTLIFCSFYAFDYIRAGKFLIGVESISPDPAPADGQTPVTVIISLRDSKGNPISGHALFAYSLNGGMFKANREITNADGKVEFIYFPYKASALMELNDARIRVIDETNSIFIEVNAQHDFNIKLTEPEKTNGDSSGHDIFGEDD